MEDRDQGDTGDEAGLEGDVGGMRSQAEVSAELAKVRDALAANRAAGFDDMVDILYGAQQALGWVLGDLASASELSDMIDKMSAMVLPD